MKKAKTKHLLWDTFIQSIFVNKVETVDWVKTRRVSPQPLEVNGDFETEPFIGLGEFVQYTIFFTE